MNSKELFFKLKEEQGLDDSVNFIKIKSPIKTSIGNITEVYRNNDNYYIKVSKEVTRTTSNAKFWGRQTTG